MTNEILLSVHGYLGALAFAALLHPAILMRRGQPLSRGVRLAVLGAALTATSVFALGIFLYGDYRAHLKRSIFERSIAAGLLFETKEHLAFAAVSFAIGGAIAALLASRDAKEIRRAAAIAFAAAALATLLVGAMGTYVAAVQSFSG